MEPSEIWARVCDTVRREIADPTVWLAMQAVNPLVIDGSFFVAALPRQEEYLAVHLLNNQATIIVEDALRNVAGRILAFRLIIGDSAADWYAEKARAETSQNPASQVPHDASDSFSVVEPTGIVQSPDRLVPRERQREVTQTWEKLSERLSQGYKAAPFIKYPHGQAQYVLTAVKMISDTMDIQMPPAGSPRDDAQERLLAKAIERLSGIVTLDPLFIALELIRYREIQGKNTDIAL